MKKKILLTGIALCMLASLTACDFFGDTSTDSVPSSESVGTSVEDTSVDASEETSEEAVHEHTYTLVAEKLGTCSTKGEISHYVCEDCGQKFDLLKNEVNSVEGDYDATNHAGTMLLTATSQPTKLSYKVGETFDPTGMVVTYKCESCEGDVVDNQGLTYTYETQDATAFTMGDTKVTVSYNGLSFDVAVTVEKAQAEISGLQASYETTCCVAPILDGVTTNVPELPLVITYYEGEAEVEPADFVAGTSYTVKVAVAETDEVMGAEATATVTVVHSYKWVEGEKEWQRLTYECACGEAENFFAMNYQSPYTDEDDLGVDLSQFIYDAENVSVKSVQQIVRMKGSTYVAAKEGTLTDIAYTNDGMVYTFAADTYEKPSQEWKPYILTLSVVYDVDGVECPLVVEVKFVDKLIKTAEDLKELAYLGAGTADEGGTANTGYYVITEDINASGLELPESKLAWQNALGFRGMLEGNDHTISNLNVAAWTYGLFGAIGENAKIQNVTFTGVKMGEGAHLFALVIRKTTFTNVGIEFDVNSASYTLADTANECTFDGVTLMTNPGSIPFWKIDNVETETAPETIEVNYFEKSVVSFDTKGGNEIAPVEVVTGRTISAPANPVKTSDEYDYEFLGWYFKGEKWDFSNPVSINMTLVAEWEEVEKTNVLYDASKKAITKWDYGTEFTSTTETDAYYGNLWKITLAGEGAEQSFQNEAISTRNFVKVYFYVYNPLAVETRLVVHGGWIAWARVTVMLAAQGWTKVEVDASVFNEDTAGQIFIVLQEVDGKSLAGEWKISSFYGLLDGEKAPEVQVPVTPEEPEEPETNVLYDASKKAITKWDYGTEFTSTTETDAYYGNLWKITLAGEGAEQSFQNEAISTRNFVKVYFYVYNPLAVETRLVVHGGWNAWARVTVMLAAQGWTKVEVDASVFNEDTAGKIFIMLQEVDGKSLAGEWKISSFYGLLDGEKAPEVQAPVTNVLVDASKQLLTKWDYGTEFAIESGTDAQYGNVWNITLTGEGAEQSFQNPAIDTTGVEKVSFYVYNPLAVEVRLVVHGGWNAWARVTVMLAAQGWTKVEVDASVFNEDTAGQIFIVIQEVDGKSLAGEWKISSFCKA